MKLVFDAGQRFTCQQCGRCCRRGWDIALTPAEVEDYRRARVERFFREGGADVEGAASDPFEPSPGHAEPMRIRKRPDGACGFLSPEDRCRIHEELGGARKPLTCRLFPFRFLPGESAPLVTASFCCPTVVRNTGAPLGEQGRELSALQRDWARAFPEPERPTLLALERRIDAGLLALVRSKLRGLLDRPGPDGAPDLRQNAARMGLLLDDWSRLRVLGLADAALAEYLELTGSFALRDAKPPARQRPSRIARLLFRGFVYAVVAARLQLEHGRHGGLRLRLTRLLLRAHGLWPGGEDLDLGAARRAALDLGRPELRELVGHRLRSSLATLGAGPGTLAEEAGLSLALLQAGCVLAGMRAGRAGRAQVDAEELAQGLMDAAELSHAEPGGAYGALLLTLSGGVEAFFLFAEGWPQRAAAR